MIIILRMSNLLGLYNQFVLSYVIVGFPFGGGFTVLWPGS